MGGKYITEKERYQIEAYVKSGLSYDEIAEKIGKSSATIRREIKRGTIRNKKKRTTVYYCHPYSSWERGSNENANRLIRRFIPKGTNIDSYSDEYIKWVENWLNNYPRKMFNYMTSNEVYNQLI